MSAAGDSSTGARALAKASWRILPLIAVGYGFAFMASPPGEPSTHHNRFRRG